MKRLREDSDLDEDSEETVVLKKTTPANVLEDLQRKLKEPDHVNEQLINTQKQYFTMYLEKLMHKIPLGKSVIETVRKNGDVDNFMYMYTASKTIIQSILLVKQTKATKAVVDMFASIACRYVHEKIITPMCAEYVQTEQLKRAYQAYQASMKAEEDDAELEMRCLLHTIHELLEKDVNVYKSVNPFKAQLTQQLKAVSDYTVALLTAISQEVKSPPTTTDISTQ